MRKKLGESLFGSKIGSVRVVPVIFKIVFTFTLFILVSNLATNYINLSYHRAELVKLMKQLLVKDLKELYNFSKNQYEIYQFNQDYEGSINTMVEKAKSDFKNSKSVAIAVRDDGTFLFQAAMFTNLPAVFSDVGSLRMMTANYESNVTEGFLTMSYNGEKYFAAYKYLPKWDVYLIRGEEYTEFYKESTKIFSQVAVLILIFTVIIALIGIVVLRHTLRYVRYFTDSIINMLDNQKMELIDLKDATNDDITFLGASFNALSSTIDNLVNIFRKFATRDVAERAYREKQIRLEGSQVELTVLFSDIKGFTYITETLGADIIKLLNMHYDKAIKAIFSQEGDIGSIIGDALLALFGTRGRSSHNKSFQAITAAYDLQDVAAFVRSEMHKIKEDIVRKRGALNQDEEMVYKAVLLEIGVGIDGGEVFYGNIGSYERMTATVIGDNVNSASRLEGLTRIYKVPVICSEFVKNDLEQHVQNHGIVFVEIDIVQVKGKTIGKKIYWPIPGDNYDETMKTNIALFSKGLQLYYAGKWREAYQEFSKCKLPLAEEFKARTEKGICPADWKGIWAMKTK